ncbi:RNA chaperone Hfq [Paenibacillus sp. M2]|uniref:RNA chaperone Hfq n=2 Tax=Paenibacillus TaxID=44249 RepID=UPI0039898A41
MKRKSIPIPVRERDNGMSNKQFELEDNTQDNLLQNFQNYRKMCTVITTNGVHLKGIIEGFDRYDIIIISTAGRKSLLSKKAISTIITEE